MLRPYEDLPARWKDKLREYIHEVLGKQRDTLGATDFRHTVSVRLPDGSYALFKYAFYIIDQSRQEVGVFTEHCGYHLFPLVDATFELLESEQRDIGECS